MGFEREDEGFPRASGRASTPSSWTGKSAHGTATKRLLIVSNRLPVTVSVRGTRVAVRPSSGGLASGLGGPHARARGLWFGWPGTTDAIADVHERELSRVFAERRIVPVMLDPEEVHDFYDELSSGVLWPVFHDRLDRLPLHPPRWEVYERVNARFADAVAAEYEPGDVVWVHDYHLMRVPALLRERLPEAHIGFFLHVPFPASDLFETLPPREDLLKGVLGADLVGFHTSRYAENFAAAVSRVLGLPADADGAITLDHRRVRLGAFPMGVDAARFIELAGSAAVESTTTALKATAHQLMVGVDRLDYSKGIPRRLLAFEELLTRHPDLRGRLRLVQVAVPSRKRVSAYQRFRREVDELVGRINGAFATPTWTPIQYIHGNVSPEMLVALYRAAAVMLVTPVRDGMNLVAKEFVASRVDEDGVLVLSEFAGAAEELTSAIVINPYDTRVLSDAMYFALTMDEPERRQRMRRMRESVLASDVHVWAERFLAVLSE